MNLSKSLVELEFFIGSQQIALDSVDLSFSIGWDFKIDFFKVNYSEF
jgi:hypothetical protein